MYSQQYNSITSHNNNSTFYGVKDHFFHLQLNINHNTDRYNQSISLQREWVKAISQKSITQPMSEVKKKNVTGSSPSDPHAIQKESNFLCCTLCKYPPIHLNEVSSSPLKGRLVFLFYYQYFKDIDNFLFAFQLVIF